jgi:molecular chaperone DnaJ
VSTKDFLEKDYYKVLGVTKTSSADEIKKSYRKLARKYHPDANKGDAKAEERFKEISEAYNTLSDTKRRKEYDDARSMFGGGFRGTGQGAPGGPGGGGFNFDLGDLFGTGTAGGNAGGGLGDILGGVFGRGGAPTSRQRPRCRSATRWTASRSASGWPARVPARPARAPAPRPGPCRGSARTARGPARRARTWAVSRSPSRATSAAAGGWWSTTRARCAPAAGGP